MNPLWHQSPRCATPACAFRVHHNAQRRGHDRCRRCRQKAKHQFETAKQTALGRFVGEFIHAYLSTMGDQQCSH